MDNYAEELHQALTRIDIAPLLAFVQACQGTLWLAGNGGSASVAQHWACDLSKAAGRRVQALGSNPAVLTAWANDSDYANVFGAELARLHQSNDALICLSCSGISPNTYWALREARTKQLPCALVTSRLYDRWVERNEADLIVSVPHEHYGVIEDCFGAIGHMLTEALCSR